MPQVYGKDRDAGFKLVIHINAPPYNNTETLEVNYDSKTEDALIKYSGLEVQGQAGENLKIAEPVSGKKLPKEDSQRLIILVKQNIDKFKSSSGKKYGRYGLSFTPAGKIERLLISDEPAFLDFISKISAICIGQDIVLHSHTQYD